ncbi:hypothetical protein, partial [Coprobacter fastidiosus]
EDNKQINVSPNFRITTFSNGLYILDDYRVFKYTRKKKLIPGISYYNSNRQLRKNPKNPI